MGIMNILYLSILEAVVIDQAGIDMWPEPHVPMRGQVCTARTIETDRPIIANWLADPRVPFCGGGGDAANRFPLIWIPAVHIGGSRGKICVMCAFPICEKCIRSNAEYIENARLVHLTAAHVHYGDEWVFCEPEDVDVTFQAMTDPLYHGLVIPLTDTYIGRFQ